MRDGQSDCKKKKKKEKKKDSIFEGMMGKMPAFTKRLIA